MVWDPKVHPRWPKGTPKPPGAGTFMDKSHMGTPAWAAAVNKQMGAPPTPKAGKSTPRPAKATKAAKATVAAAPRSPTVTPAIPAHVTPTTKAPSALVPGDVIEIPHPKHSYIAPTRGVVKRILDRGPKVDVVAHIDPAPSHHGVSNYKPQVYLPHRSPVTVIDSAAPKVSTDAELDKRATMVDRAVSGATDSATLHKQGGRWSSARAAQHQQIVSDLLARHAHVPKQHQAIMAGGMPGAGKGSVLQQRAGQYMVLDPDVIKGELAARGMVPDVPGHQDLSPLERAGLVHAESMHVVEMLGQAAYKQGTNVVWDTTMYNGGLVSSRVADLRKAGYGVRGLFVDVPFATGLARVRDRYRAGQREYEQGRGHGGRLVPAWALATYRSGNSTVPRQNWRGLRGSFDSWELWDNSGAAPVLKGSG